MKIKLIILFICFGFIVLLFPKNTYAFEFKLGPQLGLGAGFFTGEDWEDWYMIFPDDAENKPVFSFSVGLSLDMNFYQGDSFRFGMQQEFLYVFTGGGFTNDNLNVEAEYYVNTFRIPIFLKPGFKAGKGNVFLIIGPDILLSLDNKVVKRSVKGNAPGDTRVDRNYSIGLSTGLGYEFEIGKGGLYLYATYSTYFTGMVGNTMYNHIIHLNVAYLFSLVK